jgi:hypothetical protein
MPRKSTASKVQELSTPAVRKSNASAAGKDKKREGPIPGLIGEHLKLIAEDIARFNNSKVWKTRVAGDMLIIILTDGRKFKINFNRDDPVPTLKA